MFKDFSYQWIDQKQICSNKQSLKLCPVTIIKTVL